MKLQHKPNSYKSHKFSVGTP
ncbi:BnaAnng34600D [Brassica napus]|uniref:BnaAnng34600D protein n=1 Tax=Brassica napus TaxID=3708 RepID=A0A078JYQ1_BRANA|nr:BnaAnng34600D [Brassica napus]